METEWLQALGGLAAAIAAILAWMAKIKWSAEYAAAKDATISAKEAHISRLESEIVLLRKQDPVKLREHYLSVKSQHEEVIDDLKQLHARTQEELRQAQAGGMEDKSAQAKAVATEQQKWLDRIRLLQEPVKERDETSPEFRLATHPSLAALQLKVLSVSLSNRAIVVFAYLGTPTQVTLAAFPFEEEAVFADMVAAVQGRLLGQLEHVSSWVFKVNLRDEVRSRASLAAMKEKDAPTEAGQEALATQHFEDAWLAVYEAAVQKQPWPEEVAEACFSEATVAHHRMTWDDYF